MGDHFIDRWNKNLILQHEASFFLEKKKKKPLKMLIMDNVDSSFQKDEIIILACKVVVSN